MNSSVYNEKPRNSYASEIETISYNEATGYH